MPRHDVNLAATDSVTTTLAFLTELHDALQTNSLQDEAAIVSGHLDHLNDFNHESYLPFEKLNSMMVDLAEDFIEEPEYSNRI